MKHRVFLIAALFVCVLGVFAASAEDAISSPAQKETGKTISVPDIHESDLKPFIFKHEGAFLRSVQNNGHIQELISKDYNTSFRFDQEEHLQYSAKDKKVSGNHRNAPRQHTDDFFSGEY